MNVVCKLKYGNTNTFFIRGTGGNLLVDTDYAGLLPAFYRAIKANNIKISDITYLLATHYHPDHIGLVSELVKLGVKLVVVDTQREYINFADEIFKRDKHLDYKPINIENAAVIKCIESRDFLRSIGIDGEIISTPSHSPDSISLILDNGICLVGDLEPIEYLNAYENNIKLKDDYRNVMSYNPKLIYYAHINEKVFRFKK